MIKAVSLNAEGVPQEKNRREFSEKQWTDMQFQFGDKLRWIRVNDEIKPDKKPVLEEAEILRTKGMEHFKKEEWQKAEYYLAKSDKLRYSAYTRGMLNKVKKKIDN